MATTIVISSLLEGITSNIEIAVPEFDEIKAQFSLTALRKEDIPVICQWSKARWEQIGVHFALVHSGAYNFDDMSCIFRVITGAVLEDISVIFSIIKQPQLFTSYVMQKLYCVTTNITSTDLNLQDWNVKPNQIWFVSVEGSSVILYNTLDDMTNGINPVAEGTANSDLEVVLSYIDEYDEMEYYYQDVLFHLTLSTIVSGIRYFKVKPLTDMAEISDPMYNNSNIALSRGEAELNLHTYTVIGKEFILGTHIPEMEIGENSQFTSTRRGSTKIGQILSNTITGTLGDNGEASLINTITTAEYMELSK